MLLTVKDRIVIGDILPKESDLATLKLMRELKEALSFSEEELAKFELRQVTEVNDDGRKVSAMVWNRDIDSGVDIPIGVTAYNSIMDAFKNLDRGKKLQDHHVDIYERFLAAQIVDGSIVEKEG